MNDWVYLPGVYVCGHRAERCRQSQTSQASARASQSRRESECRCSCILHERLCLRIHRLERVGTPSAHAAFGSPISCFVFVPMILPGVLRKRVRQRCRVPVSSGSACRVPMSVGSVLQGRCYSHPDIPHVNRAKISV